MSKPLSVLVITNNHPTSKVKRERQQTEVFVHEVMPLGTKIEYATYGSRVQEGERAAELKEYDLVIMPGTMAEHFGTPAVIYREETTQYNPDPRGLLRPINAVPVRKKYDPKLRRSPSLLK